VPDKKAGLKRFSCGVCDRSFKYKHHLYAHRRTACGNNRKRRPHEDVSEYLRQGVTEEGMKVFFCGLCFMRFPFKNTAVRHIRAKLSQSTNPDDGNGDAFPQKVLNDEAASQGMNQVQAQGVRD